MHVSILGIRFHFAETQNMFRYILKNSSGPESIQRTSSLSQSGMVEGMIRQAQK